MSVTSYYVKAGDTVTFASNGGAVHIHSEEGSNVIFKGKIGKVYATGDGPLDSVGTVHITQLTVGLPSGKSMSGFRAIETSDGEVINF